MQEKNKILLVDDDQRNIFALRLTLSAKGFKCICVQDAREAIQTAETRNREIGLVLMDMMMPGMDGYEAMSIMKSNAVTASIPVVAVTAQAMTGDKEKCLSAGAVDYLSKPIDVDQLMNVIGKHYKAGQD